MSALRPYRVAIAAAVSSVALLAVPAATAVPEPAAAAVPAAEQRAAAPDIVSITAREYQTAEMWGVVTAAIDITVPEGTEIDSVQGLVAVNGVEKGWESFSFASQPQDFSKAELLWEPEELGIGDAQIVRSRIVYTPAGGKQTTVEDETGSNPFTVLNASEIQAGFLRTGKSLYFRADVEYYVDGESDDASGDTVLIERQTGATWTKVGTIKLDENGFGEKTLKKAKKAVYRLTWTGDEFTAPAESTTSSKV